MTRRTKAFAVGITIVAVALLGSVFGVTRGSKNVAVSNTLGNQVVSAAAADGLVRASGTAVEQTIAKLHAHLVRVPKDYPSWASLGLAYVQQAKITVDSQYYPMAQDALDTSLRINDTDNYLAYAGRSALASARHDFAAAETEARKGLTLNDSSAVLYGALGDALVQLGHYDAADEAITKMASLRPDTSSYARQSYLRELRGDIPAATTLMQQALTLAPTPSDQAFALFYLGELDFNSGDSNAALSHYRQALTASPNDLQALAGKAKAEAALGQDLTAIDDYTTVVARAPEPGLVLEFGEFLESLGRTADARAQYAVVEATQKLFMANGVAPDATPTMFYADHGQPAEALQNGERGIKTRPFYIMQDAYAWALHMNGRDREAMTILQTALDLGERSALLHYHAGMIKLALGERDAARNELSLALTLNPHFNPLAVAKATKVLATLSAAP